MTFEVSVNSWHYKLVRNFDVSRMPRSFCAYWSKLLFILAVYGFMISMAACMIGIIGFCLYTSPIASIFILLLHIAIFGFIVMVGNWITGPKKNTSLVGMKIKVWKDKVCPTIEYKYK